MHAMISLIEDGSDNAESFGEGGIDGEDVTHRIEPAGERFGVVRIIV